MACINSWSGAMTDMRDDGAYRIKISDEVWRQKRLGVRGRWRHWIPTCGCHGTRSPRSG